MNEVLEKIRKPSIFVLLLILNLRFVFTGVLGERQAVLSVLTVCFFLLSFDYTAMRREYLYWLGLFIIISLAEFTPYKLNVLTPIVLMQCISTLNMKTYLRYNIIILGTTALLMLVFFGTGYASSGRGLDFIRIRYDFGFPHPNIATIYYWGLFLSILLYCYISKYRNFVWILLGVLFALSLYLYFETISRSFMVAVIVFVITFVYYSLRARSKPDYKIGYSKYILYALPVLFTALTLYLAIYAADYPKIDILLSGRLSLYHTLLGTIAPLQYLMGTSAFDYIIVDSAYLHLLFEAGILLFVYFIYLYFFAMKNIVKQQNIIIIAIFVGFLAYGLMESLFLYSVIIGNNLLWVLLYRYRYNREEVFNVYGESIN